MRPYIKCNSVALLSLSKLLAVEYNFTVKGMNVLILGVLENGMIQSNSNSYDKIM